MNRRTQIKQKRSSYAWNYMEASKLWKGKLLTAKGLQRIAKVLRASRISSQMQALMLHKVGGCVQIPTYCNTQGVILQ